MWHSQCSDRTWPDGRLESGGGSFYKKDVRNILCALGVYDGMRSYSNYYPMEIEDVRYQSASVSGLWYPAKKPGDIIKVGEYLGCVKDYERNILETSLSDLNGVVLYQTGSLQVIKDGPMIAYGSFSRRKDETQEKDHKITGRKEATVYGTEKS